MKWFLKFLSSWFRPNHAPQFWFSHQSVQAVKDDNGLITLIWKQEYVLTPLMANYLLQLLEEKGDVLEVLRRVQDNCPSIPASSQQVRAELKRLLRGGG